jgi:hypothetical protein
LRIPVGLTLAKQPKAHPTGASFIKGGAPEAGGFVTPSAANRYALPAVTGNGWPGCWALLLHEAERILSAAAPANDATSCRFVGISTSCASQLPFDKEKPCCAYQPALPFGFLFNRIQPYPADDGAARIDYPPVAAEDSAVGMAYSLNAGFGG